LLVLSYDDDKSSLVLKLNKDVAIPASRNVIQNEVEKKLKYKNVSTEILRMWNMKCVIPVITGATRIVTKGLENLETIPGNHSTNSLPKQLY
jgi:hypothetical protein